MHVAIKKEHGHETSSLVRTMLLRAMAVAQTNPIEALRGLEIGIRGAVAESGVAMGDSVVGAGPPPAVPAHQKPAVTALMIPSSLRLSWSYTPSPDGVDSNLMLALHGLGDTPAGIDTFVRGLKLPQTAVLSISGPHTVPFFGSGFFRGLTKDGRQLGPAPGTGSYSGASHDGALVPDASGDRVRSMANTMILLHELLSNLSERCGWDASDVHGVGFGQGGSALLHLMAAQRGAKALAAEKIVA